MPREIVTRTFAGFMSYVRVDDQHENGRLTELCSRISGEVRMQLGEEFSIFQDRNDISWGQQWKQRIEDTIDATTFLIPIITPGFFRSPACRDEVERFLNREHRLGRTDLILPIYYISSPSLDNEMLRNGDDIAQIIAARQHADWRELRFEPFTSPSMGKTLAGLAAQIVRALDHAPLERSASREATSRKISSQVRESTPAEKVQRTSPSKNEPPTLIVDALHRGDYSSLTDALKAATLGHRILIRPGLYGEGVTIDKAVEIIGDGEPGEVVIEATGKNVLLFRANMGRIVNPTLRQMGGGKWYAVDIGQGRLDLEGAILRARHSHASQYMEAPIPGYAATAFTTASKVEFMSTTAASARWRTMRSSATCLQAFRLSRAAIRHSATTAFTTASRVEFMSTRAALARWRTTRSSATLCGRYDQVGRQSDTPRQPHSRRQASWSSCLRQRPRHAGGQ